MAVDEGSSLFLPFDEPDPLLAQDEGTTTDPSTSSFLSEPCPKMACKLSFELPVTELDVAAAGCEAEASDFAAKRGDENQVEARDRRWDGKEEEGRRGEERLETEERTRPD